MAQYDVFPAINGSGYLLDVQSDWISGLNTRLVVPLMPIGGAPDPARSLNPAFEIDGDPHLMVTQYLAAVPLSRLGRRVTSVTDRSEEITRALDLLLHGF